MSIYDGLLLKPDPSSYRIVWDYGSTWDGWTCPRRFEVDSYKITHQVQLLGVQFLEIRNDYDQAEHD